VSNEIYKRIRSMEDVLSNIREEAAKFDRGNMVAGTQVTKGLQEVKKKAQDTRMTIFAIKKQSK